MTTPQPIPQALRARLAEPDDEPVGLAMSAGNSYPGLTIVVLDESAVPVGTKLYTRPAARKVAGLSEQQARRYAALNREAAAR